MPEKRKPRQTPGIAAVSLGPRNDFTLPAALYFDSVYFLQQARLGGTGQMAEGYLRAALLASFACFEAVLNQTAFGHAAAHSRVLDQIERDLLEEQETFVADNGYIVRRFRAWRFETRLSFLMLFLSGAEFDRNSAVWKRLIASKALRDSWAHPKPPFDTWALTDAQVEEAIRSVRDALVEISSAMGVEPPLWLRPIEEVVKELQKQALVPPP
jgi:hypothetical protein